MGAVLHSAVIGVDVKTKGTQELDRLTRELTKLEATYKKLVSSQWEYGEAKQIVSAQTRNEVQQLRNSNVLLEAKSNISKKQLRYLVIEQREQEKYTAILKNRMDLERRALDIRNMSKTTMSGGYSDYLARESIIIEGIEKKKQIALRGTTRVANEQRKALMGASISMFVLNISMGQLVTAMKPFVKGNEDAEKALKDMSGALQFSMAPLQAYMALQMISTSLAVKQKVAFLGVAAALGAIFFWYQAITAKSPAMRAAYAAIATAATGLAIAQWVANVAIATGKTLMGDFKSVAVIIAGLTMTGAAVAAAVAYATAPKAQTLTGRSKHVRKGGLAILDDDEAVVRNSKDGSFGSGGGGDIIINLPESYTGSLSDARMTANYVRQLGISGQGKIEFKRRGIPNG
ncbi:MAG: hypothetical protein ACTSVR_04875 [Candidatus Thorarchaeota archaeon]